MLVCSRKQMGHKEGRLVGLCSRLSPGRIGGLLLILVVSGVCDGRVDRR